MTKPSIDEIWDLVKDQFTAAPDFQHASEVLGKGWQLEIWPELKEPKKD